MNNKLIRFDWAMKTLLRDKANFDVLEGFLSALLNDDDLKIVQLLESESNQNGMTEKFNRVDLMVLDSEKRKIIIEFQNTRKMVSIWELETTISIGERLSLWALIRETV